MYLGVDYYPEQWDRSLIDSDLATIREMGCNIIRIADFAWNIIEPEEGRYDFELFDEVVYKADRLGLKVMMCIPTATMPRWLALRCPEIMAQDEHGHPQPFGGRRGYCYNSELYNRKANELTRAMAVHFRKYENIVAWQLDNEIGHEGSDVCFCDSCHRRFISWLKERYDTIYDLNERWGTNFWSGSYDSFEDIQLPAKAYTNQNPSLRMEWERFRSDSIVQFLKRMYQTLKTAIPDAVVLHDFEGGTLTKRFDPFEISKNLDEVAYNNYPVWGGTVEPMKPWEIALALDTARGLKQANFWITEEIMGAQGHDISGCAIKPGQGSLWAWQAMSHGCKNFLIFRYRGATKGAEQYCYGIIDADNTRSRKFHEVKKLYEQLRQYEDLFSSAYEASCAMVFDYDSAASFRIQQQSDRFSYVGEMEKIYRQLYGRGIQTDFVTRENDLSGYEMVIVPHMIVMDDAFRGKLARYAEQGGKVVLSARSSWKDTDNNLVFGERLPVGLTDLAGVCVKEQESLLADQYRLVKDGQECIYKGRVFADMLQCTTAVPLMIYYENPFGPYAALTENQYGKGKCYYLATSLEENGMDRAYDLITGKPMREDLNVEIIERNGQKIILDYQRLTVSVQPAGEQHE
ncbi:MAG: beta-galactosidase [Erysipelotrichaceae bacterium]|nr:beta-galactosidase [Erysipelotrichaceae bacterium]MBR5048607.1 beta-galactosidase [Erysipelotrichaceae bacterium]